MKIKYKIANQSQGGVDLQGKVQWQSPSNIALIKYWGKKPQQIPCNPSLSFTLTHSVTTMTVAYRPLERGEPPLDFTFENSKKIHFAHKIEKFITSIEPIFPFLKQLKLSIHSSNTFPHSSGMASSASSMSALALCFCDIEQAIQGCETYDDKFYQKASSIARLASGSACRSIYGRFVTWGEVEVLEKTSAMYASPLKKNVHPIFQNLCDAILIVDQGEKKVASSEGHALMEKNPFKAIRFEEAKKNLGQLIKILEEGAIQDFMKVVEREALMLHAMMLCSDPHFILLKPHSLHLIESIVEFRKQTGLPLCFTIDAGPNIHLLYPAQVKKEIEKFIKDTLADFCENHSIIFDTIGKGPVKRV
ncbi:MAG: diphosphomevalonate decarboxylase [Cytophagales bacterium]|nr:diphosphomevalonate decarboxylase [Cytophagales bacterium]